MQPHHVHIWRIARHAFLALAAITYAVSGYANGDGVMKDTKTYCFGRFLIDLPKAAEVNGQAYEYMFGKIESERFLKGEEAFVQRMKAREEELKVGKHEKKFKLVDTRGSGSRDFRIFRLRKELIKGESRGFEAYRWVNGVLFSMKETAIAEDKIDSVLQRLETRLLPNLSHRPTDKIPTDPGFCIENGFIANDGKTAQYEDAGISFKFKQWPDVSIVVSTRTNGDKLEEPLLMRIKKPIPEAFSAVAKEIRQLRQGKRDIGTLRGEESLITLPTDHGFGVHHFVWEARGEPRANFVPLIHLDFDTGDGRSVNQRYMHPSLTDKQAIELFDAIVNSIRLRPTTPGKTSAAEPNPSDDSSMTTRLSLGTKVSSLRACPETGFYECASNESGVAERRVYIEQGRPMPGAFVAQSKRGITGLLGAQESKEVEAIWTLVAYGKDTS